MACLMTNVVNFFRFIGFAVLVACLLRISQDSG